MIHIRKLVRNGRKDLWRARKSTELERVGQDWARILAETLVRELVIPITQFGSLGQDVAGNLSPLEGPLLDRVLAYPFAPIRRFAEVSEGDSGTHGLSFDLLQDTANDSPSVTDDMNEVGVGKNGSDVVEADGVSGMFVDEPGLISCGSVPFESRV